MTTEDAPTGESVWLRDAGERPPRRATPLTLERIVAAAVRELDAYGAEKLTMRHLGQRLDVTSTALYWHVRTKEDLLDLAIDHVIGEVPLPDPGLEPSAAIRALLRDWRTVMLAHPWSPGLFSRPLLGPNVLARTEYLQAALTGAGLSGIELASATRLLVNFVIGAGMSDATWRRLDNPAVLDKVRAHLTDRAQLYPTLTTSGFIDAPWGDDELFNRALERALETVIPPG